MSLSIFIIYGLFAPEFGQLWVRRNTEVRYTPALCLVETHSVEEISLHEVLEARDGGGCLKASDMLAWVSRIVVHARLQ